MSINNNQGFFYTQNVFNNLLQSLSHQDTTVSYSDDGEIRVSVPFTTEKTKFTSSAAGNRGVRSANRDGYNEAKAQFVDQALQATHTTKTYQRAIKEQVDHARSYTVAVPEANEKKIETILQTCESLSFEPPVDKVGTKCSSVRENLIRCYQNNNTNTLFCNDLAKQFQQCAEL